MSVKCIPLKLHFYIAKMGFAGVYIFFLIFAPKHRLWVLVREPPQHNEKMIKILLNIFTTKEKSLHGRVFVMRS